jgi:hypothetical protein
MKPDTLIFRFLTCLALLLIPVTSSAVEPLVCYMQDDSVGRFASTDKTAHIATVLSKHGAKRKIKDGDVGLNHDTVIWKKDNLTLQFVLPTGRTISVPLNALLQAPIACAPNKSFVDILNDVLRPPQPSPEVTTGAGSISRLTRDVDFNGLYNSPPSEVLSFSTEQLTTYRLVDASSVRSRLKAALRGSIEDPRSTGLVNSAPEFVVAREDGSALVSSSWAEVFYQEPNSRSDLAFKLGLISLNKTTTYNLVDATQNGGVSVWQKRGSENCNAAGIQSSESYTVSASFFRATGKAFAVEDDACRSAQLAKSMQGAASIFSERGLDQFEVCAGICVLGLRDLSSTLTSPRFASTFKGMNITQQAGHKMPTLPEPYKQTIGVLEVTRYTRAIVTLELSNSTALGARQLKFDASPLRFPLVQNLESSGFRVKSQGSSIISIGSAKERK